MADEKPAKEYEGFSFKGSMGSIHFYTCETCNAGTTESDIVDSKHLCITPEELSKLNPEDIVENPNVYEGYKVVRYKGVCLKDAGGDVNYNCIKCNSTVTEESILEDRHDCSGNLTDRLD